MKNTLILSCYDPVHEAEVITQTIGNLYEEKSVPYNKIAVVINEEDLLCTIIKDSLANRGIPACTESTQIGILICSYTSEIPSTVQAFIIAGLNEGEHRREKIECLGRLEKSKELIRLLTFSRFTIEGKEIGPLYTIAHEEALSIRLFESRGEEKGRSIFQDKRDVLYEKLYRDKTPNEYLGIVPDINTKAILESKYDLIFSPTMLEDFSVCPYRFYLRYIVGIDTREEFIKEYFPPAYFIGTLTHDVLYSFYSKLEREKLLPLDEQRLNEYRTILDSVFAESFAKHGEKLVKKLPGVIAYLEKEIKKKVLTYISSECTENSFLPVYFEYAMSKAKDNLITIPYTSNESIYIQARIDRIDVDRKNHILRVIDYKTGKQAMSQKDLDEGKILQIPLYVYGAHELFASKGFDCNLGEAHYLFLESGIKRVKFQFTEAFKKTDLTDRIRDLYSRIIAGEFAPTPGKNRENCTFCDFNSICRTDIDSIMEKRKSISSISV